MKSVLPAHTLYVCFQITEAFRGVVELIASLAVTFQLGVFRLWNVFDSQTVERNVAMNRAAAVVPIIVSSDNALMPAEMLSGKFHSKGLRFFQR